MSIFISACIITVCVVAYALVKQIYSERTNRKIPHKEIVHINTLLQNVENYDGTPRGQKRIGGDKK